MKILIALTYYRPHYSGLTIYAEREARALVKRGHEVTILTSRFDETLLAHENCEGVEVIRPKVLLRISKGVIMPEILIHAWRLARQSDVIHLHVPQLDAAPIALIGKMLRKPVVLTYHCDLQLPKGPIHRMANFVSDLANYVTAWAADVITTNTRDYAQNSSHLRPFLDKLVPIFPPVEIESVSDSDLELFRKKFEILPGQRIIGMAARLATEKGVEYLVQALPEVLKRFPDARVLFVGPYQNVLGEMEYAARVMPGIQALGKHWTFIGTASPSEMAAFFHESEVIVLPSLNSTESFGMVQVEAMTCGTPVIASDLPGVRVPILKTGSGLLVPAADPERLSEALIEVLENPQHFRGQPENLVRMSTPEAVAEQYEHLFSISSNHEILKKELLINAHKRQEAVD
jgi:glycosyltransferase involved in cell wall biosynthesis